VDEGRIFGGYTRSNRIGGISNRIWGISNRIGGIRGTGE